MVCAQPSFSDGPIDRKKEGKYHKIVSLACLLALPCLACHSHFFFLVSCGKANELRDRGAQICIRYSWWRKEIVLVQSTALCGLLLKIFLFCPLFMCVPKCERYANVLNNNFNFHEEKESAAANVHKNISSGQAANQAFL